MTEDTAARITSADIMALHGRMLDGSKPPVHILFTVWEHIAVNHGANMALWDEEDLARRTWVSDAEIVANKRNIDRYNQNRNDAVERIDEALIEMLSVSDDPTIKLHSETAGSMIDRLSILSLKIRAMRVQADLKSRSGEHLALCRDRLDRLMLQRADLANCFDALLDDVVAKRARFKVYRQFKMYNDPRFTIDSRARCKQE